MTEVLLDLLWNEQGFSLKACCILQRGPNGPGKEIADTSKSYKIPPAVMRILCCNGYALGLADAEQIRLDVCCGKALAIRPRHVMYLQESAPLDYNQSSNPNDYLQYTNLFKLAETEAVRHQNEAEAGNELHLLHTGSFAYFKQHVSHNSSMLHVRMGKHTPPLSTETIVCLKTSTCCAVADAADSDERTSWSATLLQLARHLEGVYHVPTSPCLLLPSVAQDLHMVGRDPLRW